MKKLTLVNGRVMACLIFSFILFAISCRKDGFSPQTENLQKNKIDDSSIDKWYSDNPVSQVIPIDWKKARQAVIDGKHIVRVPTLNIDLMKASLNAKSPLKSGMLNSKGPVLGNKTALEQNPVIDDPGSGGNSNFFSAHPPEVYFVQDPATSKMHTFVTNFIPDDQSTGFGQNGNWTGKLFEWNTSSDTVLVQTFVNNVLTDRSVRKFYKVNENGGIEFSGPQKLQSLTPIKDKQVSGIFGWLADKILDGLGAIGSLLGLTTLEQSTSSSTGHHYHYRFVSHPGNPSGNEWDDTGIAGNQYVSMGLPLVGSYLSGIGSGTPYVEVTYSSYNYSGANQNNSGPNNQVPNAEGIYVMEYLTLSPAAQTYILSVEAIPVASVLKNYLDANGYTIENRELASFVAELKNSNRELNEAVLLEFAKSLQNNPLSYFADIPCSQVQDWLALAKFKPDQSINNKIELLRTKYNEFSGHDFGPFKAFIQNINKAAGSVVNMDFYPITINQLPNIGGHQYTADEFVHYLRVNINSLTDGTKTFIPYNYFGIDDRALWASNSPKGALLDLDITGPDNATVITSRSSGSEWTFTTIHDPLNGAHPVSGHRDFGYIVNSNGSYTFYTRGVDRLTTNFTQAAESITSFINGGGNGIAFSETEKLWKSFQTEVASFVNNHNGQASVALPTIKRPDWTLVKEVLTGSKPLSALSGNCPN